MSLGAQCTCGGYKTSEAIHTTSGWICGHCEWQTALCISRMGL